MSYHTLVEVREWLMLIAEYGIWYWVWKEYIYDRDLNEHVKNIKKRTKRRFEFESLTDGESK